MAKVQVKMPEGFLLRLSRLGDKTDEIIPKVLEAGGEVVEQKVRANLSAVIGRDTKEESRSTGELLSALGVTPAKIVRDGNYNGQVGFFGAAPGWAQQCHDCQRPRIREKRAACKAFYETGKVGGPRSLY